jgi:hypothetical protein
VKFPRDALVSIMGDTPETTIDLVEPRRSWLAWLPLVGGLVAACAVATMLGRAWLRGRGPRPGSSRGAVALLLGMAVLGTPRPVQAQTSDEALLETIAEVWQRREEATRSVEITWEETELIPQGALTNHPAVPAIGKTEADKGPRPPMDVTLNHEKSVILSGRGRPAEGGRPSFARACLPRRRVAGKSRRP